VPLHLPKPCPPSREAPGRNLDVRLRLRTALAKVDVTPRTPGGGGTLEERRRGGDGSCLARRAHQPLSVQRELAPAATPCRGR
jgi:hypothetical protein